MGRDKVSQKSSIWRHKNEGLSISFLGVFFPTPPLLIPHFYDVIEGLSSSSNPSFRKNHQTQSIQAVWGLFAAEARMPNHEKVIIKQMLVSVPLCLDLNKNKFYLNKSSCRSCQSYGANRIWIIKTSQSISIDSESDGIYSGHATQGGAHSTVQTFHLIHFHIFKKFQ